MKDIESNKRTRLALALGYYTSAQMGPQAKIADHAPAEWASDIDMQVAFRKGWIEAAEHEVKAKEFSGGTEIETLIESVTLMSACIRGMRADLDALYRDFHSDGGGSTPGITPYGGGGYGGGGGGSSGGGAGFGGGGHGGGGGSKDGIIVKVGPGCNGSGDNGLSRNFAQVSGNSGGGLSAGAGKIHSVRYDVTGYDPASGVISVTESGGGDPNSRAGTEAWLEQGNGGDPKSSPVTVTFEDKSNWRVRDCINDRPWLQRPRAASLGDYTLDDGPAETLYGRAKEIVTEGAKLGCYGSEWERLSDLDRDKVREVTQHYLEQLAQSRGVIPDYLGYITDAAKAACDPGKCDANEENLKTLHSFGCITDAEMTAAAKAACDPAALHDFGITDVELTITAKTALEDPYRTQYPITAKDRRAISNAIEWSGPFTNTCAKQQEMDEATLNTAHDILAEQMKAKPLNNLFSKQVHGDWTEDR